MAGQNNSSRMSWPLDLSAFSSLRAARALFSVDDAVWTAFVQSAGGPGDDHRLLAALPPSAIAAAVEGAALVNGDQLTVIQAAQLGLVYRLARRKIHADAGLDLQLWVDPDPWKEPSNDTPAMPTVPRWERWSGR